MHTRDHIEKIEKKKKITQEHLRRGKDLQLAICLCSHIILTYGHLIIYVTQ